MSTPRTLVAPSVAVAASGPTTIVFPEIPRTGNEWDLRRVTITDAADLFYLHCKAISAIATPNDPQIPPGPLEAVDFAAGLPEGFTWSRGTIILFGSERIVCWVMHADAGRSLTATAQIEETLNPRRV